MRKIINPLLAGVLGFAVLIFLSCEEPKPSSPPVNLSGSWDLAFFQASAQTTTYTLEVTTSGGSGSAQVKVYNDKGDSSPPTTVSEGSTIALGSCGLWVLFSSTVGSFNLVAGDRWQIVVVRNMPQEPEPHPENQSQVALQVGGTYTCLVESCSSGIWKSSSPISQDFPTPLGTEEYELLGIKTSQNDSNLSGVVLEENILSLNLVEVSAGDIIRLCYQRRLEGANDNSFFWTRAVNANQFLDLEYHQGDDFNQQAKKTCQEFIAGADELRIDFISALESASDIIWLDEVEVFKNNQLIFSDDFESGDFKNDLPAPQKRWELRSPEYMFGGAGISSIKPLLGNYSYRVVGGRALGLSGSVLENVSTQYASFLGQVQGMKISGVLFEIYENKAGGFFATFSGNLVNNQSAIGTFGGRGTDCQESGQFILSINAKDIYPLNQSWQMSLTGTATNCQDISDFTKSFKKFEPTQKGDRFYSKTDQPLVDELANEYQLRGRVLGTAVYFTLEDVPTPSYQNAIFYGIINTEEGVNPEETNEQVVQVPNIVGVFSGWLKFESGWKCQTEGNFTVYFPENPIYVPVNQ